MMLQTGEGFAKLRRNKREAHKVAEELIETKVGKDVSGTRKRNVMSIFDLCRGEEHLRAGDGKPTAADVDAMPFFQTFLNEVVRVHVAVPHMYRCPVRDEVLLLSMPTTTRMGKVIREVPVCKTLRLILSIPGYNICVWEEDAHEFNPEQFRRPTEKNRPNVGLWANTGVRSRGCRTLHSILHLAIAMGLLGKVDSLFGDAALSFFLLWRENKRRDAEPPDTKYDDVYIEVTLPDGSRVERKVQKPYVHNEYNNDWPKAARLRIVLNALARINDKMSTKDKYIQGSWHIGIATTGMQIVDMDKPQYPPHGPVESTDCASLLLHVLAEATKRPKLNVAPLPLLWTAINRRLVDGAQEMLIEPLEPFELAMAQRSFVSLPVTTAQNGDEARWVCDDVGLIQVDGELNSLVAVHFRTACTRLEMTDKGRCRAKATVTLAPRTRYQGHVEHLDIRTSISNCTADRRQAPLGPDTPLFGSRIPPGTLTQSPNTSISPSTLFDTFDGARRLLEARHGRPDASRVDPGTSSAFGEQ
ncbi:predicted protein [Postia placenta Mad-698-R]|nr:predicted protein [Postia placenta Mad-698-R]